MNAISKNIRKHMLFYIVLSLSIFLRLYRIGDLTTFGVDQGVDFLVVRDMVVYHKWTLIGIKSSIGEFFQGPIALYMLYPLFYLMNLNPIAGAYTALLISILTLTLLYITVNKYFSKKAAVFSCLLFAVSPELIMYGNSPLYQHFLPFFIIAGIYLLLKKNKSITDFFLIGLTVGLGMELHFLNVILLISIFIYYLIYEFKGVSRIVAYALGTFFGLLPTIIFELRHNFLNTHLFLEYVTAGGSGKFTLQKYLQWGVTGGRFLGGDNAIVAAMVLLSFFYLVIFSKAKRGETITLKRLGIILFMITNLMLLPLSNFYSQYAQGFWLTVMILIPVYLIGSYKAKTAYTLFFLLVIINFGFSLSRLSYDHGYNMPDGVSLNKIEKIGGLITEDAKTHPNFNIASILDGGTRAYQYRYSVLIRGGLPQPVTDYPNNNFLYLISRKNFDARTWEVSSMKPFTVGSIWDSGNGVYLYRLDRVLKN